MPTSLPIKEKIKKLKLEYDTLRRGKDTLLQMIDDAEVPEMVYNSNAIENSTLTLKETERILLEMEISRDVSLREVYEAKNLSRVIGYIRTKVDVMDITKELILLLHKMLIGGINDDIAGRFRQKNEYVRIGTFIAPPPEHVEVLIENELTEYSSDLTKYFADKIALFHLKFESTHPFNDGNGRIGRVLMNYQLQRLGFPMIIIRDKEKQAYYKGFQAFNDDRNTKPMEKVVSLALTESLHKRNTYLKGESITFLSEYAKKSKKSVSALLNAARRQSIPAFREKGIWKIGQKFELP